MSVVEGGRVVRRTIAGGREPVRGYGEVVIDNIHVGGGGSRKKEGLGYPDDAVLGSEHKAASRRLQNIEQT